MGVSHLLSILPPPHPNSHSGQWPPSRSHRPGAMPAGRRVLGTGTANLGPGCSPRGFHLLPRLERTDSTVHAGLRPAGPVEASRGWGLTVEPTALQDQRGQDSGTDGAGEGLLQEGLRSAVPSQGPRQTARQGWTGPALLAPTFPTPSSSGSGRKQLVTGRPELPLSGTC